MKFNINTAINAYSHSMGNQFDVLIEHCGSEKADEFKKTIDQIQNEIFDIIWKSTDNNNLLTAGEIEEIATEYCNEKHNEIDASGIDGLLRWLIWMAWHEGCLKKGI